jgi:retron-type reverse transcriptase
VRAVRASSIKNQPPKINFGGFILEIMQLSLFHIDSKQEQLREIEVEQLFEAYLSCRKTKRYTQNALKFEVDYEANLFQLKDEIENGSYSPGRSIAFIVKKPVMREIFAADFRDRVVHHWLINKLNPLFENLFIHDSYACRVGKGTHYGVKRADAFIKACSENYTKDCYILKLDVQGFFMHINRKLLFEMIERLIHQYYTLSDKSLVLEITKKIIFNQPTQNCIIKGNKKDWDGLPKNKSLFHSPQDCGLPIGNLTSQVFANFYMHHFDAYVTKELGIKYYGRYVDDFVIVHQDQDYLKLLIHQFSDFLFSTLQLTLHPKKIYLQHYSKGVKFLGTVIKPNRTYIANRTKGNFYNAIDKQNRIVRDHKPSKEEKAAFLSSMNSYLGIMKHYKSFNLRKEMIFKNLNGYWWNHVYLSDGIAKFEMKVKSVKKNQRNANMG